MLDIAIPVFLGKLGKIPFQTARFGIPSGATIKLDVGNTDPLQCQIVMPRPLTAFDGRVYSAICGLHAEDIPLTPRTIYHATGVGDSELNSRQRTQILEIATTLMHTNITLRDQMQTVPLLTGSINQGTSQRGRFASPDMITLSTSPGLYEYITRTDKYLSMVPVKQLVLPDIYRTDTILATQTYMFERILRARHGNKRDLKITFDSLFDALHVNASPTDNQILQRQITRHRAAVRNALITVANAAIYTGAILKFDRYPTVHAESLFKCTGIQITLR